MVKWFSLLLCAHLSWLILSVSIPNSYTKLSLQKLCAKVADEGSIPPIVLEAGRNRSAVVLYLNASSSSPPFLHRAPCQIRLVAPKQHVLAASYLRADPDEGQEVNDTCPLNLTFAKLDHTSRVEGVCEKQNPSGLPRLLTSHESLVVVVEGLEVTWPTVTRQHFLVITAVSLDEGVCRDHLKYFTCDWRSKTMSRPSSGDLQPSMCVSHLLACDGIINCPLSGGDETSVLCGSKEDKLSSVHQQQSQDTSSRVSQLIQQSAARVAANLNLYGAARRPSTLPVSQQADDHQQELPQAPLDHVISASFSIVDVALFTTIGVIALLGGVSLILALYFYYKRRWLRRRNPTSPTEVVVPPLHSLCTHSVPHSSSSTDDDMVTASGPSTSSSAHDIEMSFRGVIDPPSYQEAIDNPPTYISLYPRNNKPQDE